MAILKSSLEEPLLSREQMSIIRDIAHAAQLAEAIKQFNIVTDYLIDPKTKDQWTLSTASKSEKEEILENIQNYLKAEINRVLMQIKVPRRQLAKEVKADTKDSVVKPSVVTPS